MWYCPCGWTLEVLGGRKGRILTVKMSCAEWCHHIISKLWSNKYILVLYHVNIMYECVISQTWHNWFQCVWEFRSLQRIKVTHDPWDAWNLLSTGCWAQDWQRAAILARFEVRNTVLHEERVYGSFLRIAADITQSIWTQISCPKSPKNYSSLVCWPSTHSRVFFQ